MKSILQEAASVERAIDKAWNEAGKPKEFTIKVHDEGERNFLGMSRRLAVISILFVPRRDRKFSQNSRSDRSRDNVRSRQPRRRQGLDSGGRDGRSGRSCGNNFRESRGIDVRSGEWRADWERFVVNNMRDLVKLMGVAVPFDVSKNKSVLTIMFKEAVLGNEEEQRMLFASLSYLSIQFLKRYYKNRFVGYRIIVTCKQQGAGSSFSGDARLRRSTSSRVTSSQRKQSSSSKDVQKQTASTAAARKQQMFIAGQESEHLAEQLRFAKQQLELGDDESAEEDKTVTQVSKLAAAKQGEKEKYPPFYVLPEEEPSSSSHENEKTDKKS